MSVIKITEQQKQRLVELYNIPTSELKSKDIPLIIEQEMGFKVPYNFLNDFYQNGFGLDIAKRKRKTEAVTFEFENGKKFQLNNVEPQEDQIVSTPPDAVVEQQLVLSDQKETAEEELVDVTEEVKDTINPLIRSEPSKFEF